ncbi:MAG: class I SAM-dependent methyltransferase [Armatimonadetes bacterium]|nr:class I SAM-dependent methyltransferase [Armatimonadota bacterium]
MSARERIRMAFEMEDPLELEIPGEPEEDPEPEVEEEHEPSVNVYRRFADIYDVFGSEDFCLAMTSYLLEATEKYRIATGTVCADLACGTGVITVELAKAGFSMIGIDRSGEMLRHARKRSQRAGQKIRFYQMDMRDFVLEERVPLVISTHDSLDHLYEPGDLKAAFRQCAYALRPGGYFMFDMNCWEGIRHLDGRTVFVESEDRSGAYHLIARDQTLETNIVGFLRQKGNLYQRFDETLFQRCYPDEEIERLLETYALALVEKIPVQHLEGDVFKQLWITRLPGQEMPELL